jgi:hypothetical protein
MIDGSKMEENSDDMNEVKRIPTQQNVINPSSIAFPELDEEDVVEDHGVELLRGNLAVFSMNPTLKLIEAQ